LAAALDGGKAAFLFLIKLFLEEFCRSPPLAAEGGLRAGEGSVAVKLHSG